MSTASSSRDDHDASSDASIRSTSDQNENETDEASSGDDASNEASETDARPSAGELEEELERLRAEVTRLRARQAASERASWFHRHPGWALFVTTALGAAAGYAAARVGAPDDAFSETTRRQLRHLAEQARDVASEVQHEIEERTRSLRNAADDGATGSPSGDGAPATRPSEDEAAMDSRSLAQDAVERMVGSARKARSSVRDRARSATQDAAQRAVRSFASEDDVVPVELKAKAAGMAASTLGAALARKVLRSAGRVATSMILAYLTKKVLDVVRGR